MRSCYRTCYSWQNLKVPLLPLPEHRIAQGSCEFLLRCWQSTHCLIIMGCSSDRISAATVIVTVIPVNLLFLDFRKVVQKWRFSVWWSSPGILAYFCTVNACMYLLKMVQPGTGVSLTTLAPSRAPMKLRWGKKTVRGDGMTQGIERFYGSQ